MFKHNIIDFEHHRKGWVVASEKLHSISSSTSNVELYDWADWKFREGKEIKENWIGFLHNVLTYPEHELPHKYQKEIAIHPLSKLVQEEFFRNSLKACYGLFTLCKNNANFLKRNVDVPVSFLWHPVEIEKNKFQWSLFKKNPKVTMIGQWMRRYQSLDELDSCYEKILLKTKGFDQDYTQSNSKCVDYLTNEDYDNLLTSSIVFLDLYDAAACNTILECIARNTPVMTNILPATVEYLGKEYPLFFESLNDARDKLRDNSILISAHEYLQNMDKSHLNPNSFMKQFQQSEVIQNLPIIKL